MPKSIVQNGHSGAGRLLAILMAAAALMCAGCTPAGYSSAQYDEPEVSDYEFLSEYGEWISMPHYGPVWRPYVVAGWAPYYYGHWIWTDDGWAWVSYEPFGMLVYHYGYWDYSLRFGWVWIPGDVWSPARVEWYTFDGYCAWAPMPPPRMGWNDPWETGDIYVWIVVPVEHFTDESVGQYRLPESARREFVRREGAVKNPPTARQIETATKGPVHKIPMERERVPIDRDVTKTQQRSGRQTNSPLRKMVLPEQERDKVDEHSRKVKREVLTPRKKEPENRKDDNKTRETQGKKEKGRR